MPGLVAVMLPIAFENLIAQYLLLGRDEFPLYPWFSSMPFSEHFIRYLGGFFPSALTLLLYHLANRRLCLVIIFCPKYGGRRRKLL